MALGASPLSLNGICFRLRMMSVASSTTPGIDWNSCSTPSILTAVTAAPSMEESMHAAQSRCRWWCRSRVQRAGPRRCRTCRLGLRCRLRDVSVFEIPSKALRCSPSAVWLSPDIPEQVRVSFRSSVRDRLIWLELLDQSVGRQSSVVSQGISLTTEDRRLTTYLLYNSTINCSFTGRLMSSRLGRDKTLPL